MINEDIRKQLCIEKLTLVDVLPFAVKRERGEILSKRVGRGYQNYLGTGSIKATNSQQTGSVKRERVNKIKGQQGDQCHYSES